MNRWWATFLCLAVGMGLMLGRVAAQESAAQVHVAAAKAAASPKTANPKHAAALRRLWLKQVREDGRTSKPASLVDPATRTKPVPSAPKKDEPAGALSGIMGIFGKKK